MFKLVITETFEKDLKKLNKDLVDRIIKVLEILKENPFNLDIKKLKNKKLFRVRVGNYRVIIRINFEQNTIYILRVLPRGRVYKNL
jgi:mRNA interferase RelE/StbE